ncbi:hypothetical protein DXB87_16860 [Phocaeicola plebeius]|uniref:Uncharacterized protein n=1 Tax=Phocaeicola plebeius TaxID=310297 RepID=A0A3E4Z3R3_9BACT|nr:hypothetical protein DXB87_16860 [Phocaeicola plebeius]
MGRKFNKLHAINTLPFSLNEIEISTQKHKYVSSQTQVRFD